MSAANYSSSPITVATNEGVVDRYSTVGEALRDYPDAVEWTYGHNHAHSGGYVYWDDRKCVIGLAS